MAKTIVWNKRALSRFNEIVKYLDSDWNETVSCNFVVKTYQLIELLSDYPDIGTLENAEQQIRALVITKHNIMFYRYTKDELIILNIFDTRQNPSKKKF